MRAQLYTVRIGFDMDDPAVVHGNAAAATCLPPSAEACAALGAAAATVGPAGAVALSGNSTDAQAAGSESAGAVAGNPGGGGTSDGSMGGGGKGSADRCVVRGTAGEQAAKARARGDLPREAKPAEALTAARLVGAMQGLKAESVGDGSLTSRSESPEQRSATSAPPLMAEEAEGEAEVGAGADEGADEGAEDWLPGARMPNCMLADMIQELGVLLDTGSKADYAVACARARRCTERADSLQPHEWAGMVEEAPCVPRNGQCAQQLYE